MPLPPLNLNLSMPNTSGGSPINAASTGPIVFGGGAGSSTSGSAGLPTPNSIFGQSAFQTALGNPFLMGGTVLLIFAFLSRRK